MRRFIVAISLCGALAAGCEPVTATKYNPQSNSKEERTMENCSIAVAEIMGIPWTPENGATEELDTFNRRVRECMVG